MQNFRPGSGHFCKRWHNWGWTIGRNMRIDIRWATANHAEIRKQAAELVALAPGFWHLDRRAAAAGDAHHARRQPL
jgi:hypothetical protein